MPPSEVTRGLFSCLSCQGEQMQEPKGGERPEGEDEAEGEEVMVMVLMMWS
jgi:hypothetical protein